MPRLKHAYAGTPHRRVINARDFKSVGVDDQEKVEWTPENKHVAEVSEAAATWLTENEPGDWEVLEEPVALLVSSDDEALSSSESGGDDEGTSGSSKASRTTRRSSSNS